MVEYYSVVKKEILSFAVKWISLEDTLHSVN
jgi:hypothetical protein